MRTKRKNELKRYAGPAALILFTTLAGGCATVDHTHPQYEANMQAVQEATQRANQAAERANTAAGRTEQAAVRSEAAAVRAEQAALKAEAIFKQALRK